MVQAEKDEAVNILVYIAMVSLHNYMQSWLSD